MISRMEELQAMLAAAQKSRESRIACELTLEMSARVTDQQLTEALVTGLPMAQGILPVIRRSRGRGARLTAKVRYREGVRMLDFVDGGAPALTAEETAALEKARAIAARVAENGDEARRFHCLFSWLCGHVRYAHTAPGQKGYRRLVGAVGAMLDGQANCQGFADALYLLCGLCGIKVELRCGRGEKQLHAWNAVFLNGQWQEADASKGARRTNV